MKAADTKYPPFYVVSGGIGASGEQLIQTALAQFEKPDIEVTVIPHVRTAAEIENAVKKAAATGGTILHTLVDLKLRQAMIRHARDQNVVAIDAMGQLLSRLTKVLGQEPQGQPGLYRQLRQDYFDRVAAIEYTVAHDDGHRPDEWHQAEIMLVGVSRAGKTPLSMYLSTLGWKVANYPLVMEVEPPSELFQLDPRRVVGLIIDPGQLVTHREQRQRRLGVSKKSAYTNPASLFEEGEAARKLYRRHGFATVNVTDKPIEESADDIIALINRRLKTTT
jgi:[pyruvate, water dikinase]-phosphate phosphotransferase / [pyruvate, water dikinase] kinase